MKVGIALNMLSEPPRPDVAVVSDHLAMGDLAEPLGFDSLFALEHHFTGYAMSPAPLELLAYFAGRTKRITFGTAVIVLPWHDPIRVAEGIALLDILSAACSVLAAVPQASNTKAFASRWAKHGRALPRPPS
jgi:alkanesulfonate monooxygenase SsuD/methylene tetrahydromethanopterin reductase-like flavin-dependent oxidoreductase (luciferase family)